MALERLDGLSTSSQTEVVVIERFLREYGAWQRAMAQALVGTGPPHRRADTLMPAAELP